MKRVGLYTGIIGIIILIIGIVLKIIEKTAVPINMKSEGPNSYAMVGYVDNINGIILIAIGLLITILSIIIYKK